MFSFAISGVAPLGFPKINGSSFGKGALIVRFCVRLTLLACASEATAVTTRLPPVVFAGIVAENEKILSFGVTSPFVPLSKKVCVAEPPMSVRFPTTVIPVLGGVVAGMTETVKSVFPLGETVVGLAEIPACRFPPRLQLFVGLEVFRGAGVPNVKSRLLLSVSVQPPLLRINAVVADKFGVLVPSKQLAVSP